MRYAVKRAVKFFFFCNCLLVFLYKNKKSLYKNFLYPYNLPFFALPHANAKLTERYVWS